MGLDGVEKFVTTPKLLQSKDTSVPTHWRTVGVVDKSRWQDEAAGLYGPA